MGRYEKNFPAITADEQRVLAQSRVFLAGCGGLGCYIAELLARTGVGSIKIADGDVFSESNLNRQLYATADTLGIMKPLAAAQRLRSVNPEVSVTPVCRYLTDENADELLEDCDIAVDALDNAPSRLTLAGAAAGAGLCLVTGAIDGWQGRVTVIGPEDGETARFLWGEGAVSPSGNLGCTASCVASVVAAETVKTLLGRGETLRGRFLELDLLRGVWETLG